MNRLLNIIGERAFLNLSKTDLVICLWYVYVLISAWTYTAYPCSHTIVGATYMLSLYLFVRIIFSISHVRDVYVVFGIILWTIFELGYGVMQLVEGSSNHYLYPMTGTFLNPGPYAAGLALGLVMLCQYRRETGNGILIYKGVTTRHIIEIVLLCFVIILPSTWSRAAMLSVAICLCMIYWENVRKWIWLVICAGIVAFTVMYFVKAGSANGRFAVNIIAMQCVTDSPIIGNGIGGFFHAYAEKTAQMSVSGLPFDAMAVDVLDYAFNDMMLIAVEQGLVGLMFAVVLLTFTFRALYKKSRCLMYGLLALVVFSLFSYPFELLPYQIIAVIIIAYSANTDEGIKINVFVVVAVAVSLAILPLDYAKAKKKAEDDYRMMSGMTDKAFIDDYYELLPSLDDNRNFLFDFGKALSLQGRYNDSNAMLRMGTLVSNDPMFYVVQGNNYKEMMAYDKAEAMYWKAYNVMPNRLYPLYKLMLLYQDIGEKGKAAIMARRIIGFKEKVVSPATKDMKKEAKQLIKEQI